MPLADAEQVRLRVLVTPVAWAAHQALPAAEQVSPEEALAVHGDLRLVAADVLEVVCLAARGKAATSPGKRRVKLGPLEVERAAAGSVDAAQAESWCALAARLRAQAEGSGVPGAVLTGWAP